MLFCSRHGTRANFNTDTWYLDNMVKSRITEHPQFYYQWNLPVTADHTVGTGLFIQWINSEYIENKFKISSNTNSLIIFWIYLKFILQFVSILFSAYIQNIVAKYTVNIFKSKCGGHLSTATCYLHQIDLLSHEIWKEQERDDGHTVLQ